MKDLYTSDSVFNSFTNSEQYSHEPSVWMKLHSTVICFDFILI